MLETKTDKLLINRLGRNSQEGEDEEDEDEQGLNPPSTTATSSTALVTSSTALATSSADYSTSKAGAPPTSTDYRSPKSSARGSIHKGVSNVPRDQSRVPSSSPPPPPAQSSTTRQSTSITRTPFIYTPDTVDDTCHLDTFLVSWDLIINKDARAIICTACGKALPPSNVKNHVHDNHRNDFSDDVDYAKLKVDTLREMYSSIVNFEMSKKYFPTTLPCAPFSYVTTKRGWTCVAKNGEQCFYSAETEDALKKHKRVEHNGSSEYCPEESWIQSLYSQNLRQYFPVILPVVIPNNIRALLENVKRQAAEMKTKAISSVIPEKQRPAFFREHRLYEFLEKFEVRQIIQLGENVQSKRVVWEDRLRKVVLEYFAMVNRSLASGEMHSVVADKLKVKDDDSR